MAATGASSTSTLSMVPNILNVSLPTASVEVAVALPNKTAKILIRARSLTTIRFAFHAGDTNASRYMEIGPGGSYNDDGLDLVGVTLYVQADRANAVIEILSWSLG